MHCIEQGGMENDKGTLPGSICGHEGILFRRWDLMKKSYGSISVNRRKTIFDKGNLPSNHAIYT